MKKRLLGDLLFAGLLVVAAACTQGKNSQTITQEERDEVLEGMTVFNSQQTLASFQEPSDVQSFNGDNRPVVKAEDTICEAPETPGDNEDTDTLPPPTPECQEGFEAVGDSCQAICGDEQTFAQGQCFDNVKECPVENGEGVQEWMANAYSSCQVTSCNEGFENQNNSCIAQCKEGEEVFHNGKCQPIIADCKVGHAEGSMVWNGSSYGECQVEDAPCPIDNGEGIARWIASKKKHGKCEATSCEKGFRKKNKKCEMVCGPKQISTGKKCVDLSRPCPIAGGEGRQWWNRRRGRYKRCLVVGCDDGFVRRGNSCVGEDIIWGGGNADPLIVDLGADTNLPQGISLSSQADGILFNILGQNSKPNPNDKKQISWTTNPRYQFIVRPDSNGQVTGIDQMFGDNTLGPDGQFSREGFEALGKFDIDSNGRIDLDDPVFTELALWNDSNGNGAADLGELVSLRSAEIDSIDLNYDPNFFEVDQYGNKTSYKSIVSFSDGRKTLIFDLWFRYFEPKNCAPPNSGTPPPGGDVNVGF